MTMLHVFKYGDANSYFQMINKGGLCPKIRVFIKTLQITKAKNLLKILDKALVAGGRPIYIVLDCITHRKINRLIKSECVR